MFKVYSLRSPNKTGTGTRVTAEAVDRESRATISQLVLTKGRILRPFSPRNCAALLPELWHCCCQQEIFLSPAVDIGESPKEGKMASELNGLRVAILVANGFEQIEMTEPKRALEAAGAVVKLVSPEEGEVKGWNHTAICHAPWTLIDAEAVDGLRITSWPSIKTDLINAGANWVDEEVVRDGQIVTSRKPDDLPVFNREMIKMFGEQRQRAKGTSK